MLKFPRLLVNHVKALATPTSSSNADYLSQQTRNTFILKRRNPVPLHKKNSKPHRLRTRHFIYDLVEDTNVKKKEPLDLILTQYVAGFGNVGTRVSLHPTTAYSKLLLPKLADYATPENIEKYTKLAVDQEGDKPFSSSSVEKTMKYLSRKRISIVMSKDVPWTLEKWHIKANFRKAGIYLPEDSITMPVKPISGPNLDLQGKEFYVTITINNREQVKVRCNLHHWTPESSSQIYVSEFWKLPADPIFPEDKPILDSLPPFWIERKKKTTHC
ncbi:PREDICTED: 39S ribosomal protein L9, mitochondrial [Trachymyrmex cornetzi]|uniref:39S ribosomal protein L9, mitochondrial n=1 Tax=Trachymyrmex cornetzi TaxID=471704 RepID=UPI00084F65E4|nr:PREDICTED: 39S ribosomal protein L9, mitochondrial [Trachymyrmex cornetzi]XP_018364539.1 PREDICTED: 39S ribosomal protein L9, mitochondrial [Trachymyrmex cornetzi]XP_018364540.1 PREDICTED: 39S ribosomal protein L9, mitochondrial [Trachymyrmex cornetzi]XP_018364541.1 PREDICTED: 39S ribosomal protein L9, mitochondrial [Trachymyrmex cornetzi]